MGLSTEQTTAVIESVAKVVDAAQPDAVMQAQPNMNFWPLLLLGIIPVYFGYWLNNRRKKK